MTILVGEKLRLSGGSTSDRDAVFLVPGTRAIALCDRQGCQRVTAAQAMHLFHRMGRRERAQIRTFAARLRLSPFPLASTDDAQLSQIVTGLIRTGALVGIRWQEADADSSGETVARRKLVRKIEAQTRGQLNLAGRNYRLVVDVDLARVPHRDDYEVVGRTEAVEIIARIAAQQSAAAPLLRQAREQLSKDWRPPFSEPDGIILLRRQPIKASLGVERGPTLSPSQIAKLIAAEESVTLQVVVLGLDDQPLDGVSYVIETPDAESFDGDLGPSGKTKVRSAKKGTAGVTLTWTDPDASA